MSAGGGGRVGGATLRLGSRGTGQGAPGFTTLEMQHGAAYGCSTCPPHLPVRPSVAVTWHEPWRPLSRDQTWPSPRSCRNLSTSGRCCHHRCCGCRAPGGDMGQSEHIQPRGLLAWQHWLRGITPHPRAGIALPAGCYSISAAGSSRHRYPCCSAPRLRPPSLQVNQSKSQGLGCQGRWGEGRHLCSRMGPERLCRLPALPNKPSFSDRGQTRAVHPRASDKGPPPFPTACQHPTQS